MKTLFVKEHGVWKKVYNVYNKQTNSFTTKSLPTTDFEKANGYSRKQAVEWGLIQQ
jgi:hypothetical protein